jgi:hypothetical protein
LSFKNTTVSLTVTYGSKLAEGEDWALAGFALMAAVHHIWSQNSNVM